MQRREPGRALAREKIGLGDVVSVFDVPAARVPHARLVQAGAGVVEEPFAWTSARRDESGAPQLSGAASSTSSIRMAA